MSIFRGSKPGRGAPGERESAARGRDLSEPNPAVHSAAEPIVFSALIYLEPVCPIQKAKVYWKIIWMTPVEP